MTRPSPHPLVVFAALALTGSAAAVPSERWLGPCVSGSGAAGSRYTTTLTLGDGPLGRGTAVALEYWASGRLVAQEAVSIPAGGTLRRAAPPALEGEGAFLVRAVSDDPIVAFSETANRTEAGRFGVAVPSFAPQETLSTGDVATFRGASASADPHGARGNAGLLCLPGGACTAAFTAIAEDGRPLGSGTLEAPAAGAVQLSLSELIPEALGLDGLSVRVTATKGRFRPYVVRNDNGSSDGALVPFAIDRTHGSTFVFPLGCRLNYDCWVANYTDRTRGAARDFAGGTVTYSRHDGTDFLINGFTAMDLGVDVYAAAEGVVTQAVDGFDDRCVTGECTGTNGIVLLHADGTATEYLHLRKGSLLVTPGLRVTRGQKIAEVGSSGPSTDTHLHFTWLLPNPWRAADPFTTPEDGLVSPWEKHLGYSGFDGTRLARLVISASPLAAASFSLDPPAATALRIGQIASAHIYGIRIARGTPLTLVVRDGTGTERSRNTYSNAGEFSFGFFAYPIVLSGEPGTFTLEILEGARPLGKRAFRVD